MECIKETATHGIVCWEMDMLTHLSIGDAAEPYVHDPTGETVAEVPAVVSNDVEEASVVEAA